MINNKETEWKTHKKPVCFLRVSHYLTPPKFTIAMCILTISVNIGVVA